MSTKTRKRATETELVPLSPEEIRRLAKPHKGFEQFVPTLLTLYRANEKALVVEGLDVSAVEEALSVYETLAPAEAEAAEKLALIQATRLLHGSAVWTAELEIYARAQGAGRTNPAIRRAIAGFASFMKRGPRAKKKPPSGT